MKKSLLILLLLAGFSAYALNSKSGCETGTTSSKTTEKKVNTRTLSPLADLFSFSI